VFKETKDLGERQSIFFEKYLSGTKGDKYLWGSLSFIS
jgi:hypothetical protein